MALPVRCPRCSARRIEGVDTCPRCQWRFASEAPTPPPAQRPSAPSATSWRAQDPSPADKLAPGSSQPVRVQIEAMDRRTVARFSLAAFQVRCLGTLGGCLGMLIGAFAGSVVAAGLTHNAFMSFPGFIVGAMVGMVVGILVSLRLMAR